eukprot:455752_1
MSDSDSEIDGEESRDVISQMRTSMQLQIDPKYYIDRDKYRGYFRGYIRQDWSHINLHGGLEEQRAEWIELFFDLMFVACIVHISSEAVYSIPSDAKHRRLASSTHPHDALHGCHPGKYDYICTCFAQFGLLTLSWVEQTMMESHFVFNQKIDVIFRLMFMAFVICAGLFIHNDPYYHIAFQVSYLCLKIVCIIIYVKASLIPRARKHALWHIVVSSITSIALICTAALYRGCAMDYFIMYSTFFVFEYMSNVLEWTIAHSKTGHLAFALPLHVAHISERFGLFIMLILGESIIAIITADLGAFEAKLFINIAFVICTFFMTFCIATLYFDCQPSEEDILHGTNNHALRTTKWSRLFYIFGHHLLFFGLLAFGIGIKISGKHLFDNVTKREWIDVMLPGYGLVIVIIALNIIRVSHPHVTRKKIIWTFRVLILIVMCVMPMFALLINQGIIFVVMFVCLLGLNMLDVEGSEKRKKAKEEFRKKREHTRNLSNMSASTTPMHPALTRYQKD